MHRLQYPMMVSHAQQCVGLPMVKLAYLKFRPNSFSKLNNLGILYGNQIEGFIILQTEPPLKGVVWFIDSHQSTTDKDNRNSKYLQAACTLAHGIFQTLPNSISPTYTY